MSEFLIKELDTPIALGGCVDLQKKVFDMPEVEISPVRHFIVTMHAGGFTLGAFDGDRLIGFCLSVPAMVRGERAFYSHMTAVDPDYQGHGIGSALKRRQRERSLKRGVSFIKWTFQPEKSLNAYFNLEKLGAQIHDYMPNFYGTDYGISAKPDDRVPIDSDRLFALWDLQTPKVNMLARGESYTEQRIPVDSVNAPADWSALLSENRRDANRIQARLRSDFQEKLDRGLVCLGFKKDASSPAYLFFEA